MERAPFYNDITDGSEASVYWLSTSDGVRIRLGVWPNGTTKATKGTILIFPGRTEYIEKYAHLADPLAQEGFTMIAIDWRGQGIADRLLDNPLIGHVDRFPDYQKDVAAVLTALAELNLPKPYYLLGHSMGAAIGIRALKEGLPVNAASFCAPMWGIGLARVTRSLGWLLSSLSKRLGLSAIRSPGTCPKPKILRRKFEGNTFTSDRTMFDMVHNQVSTHPELGLAGPSLSWFYESLKECKLFHEWDKPPVPTFVLLGTDEDIVDCAPIHTLCKKWGNASLRMLKAARHEILIETPALQKEAISSIVAHFNMHR